MAHTIKAARANYSPGVPIGLEVNVDADCRKFRWALIAFNNEGGYDERTTSREITHTEGDPETYAFTVGPLTPGRYGVRLHQWQEHGDEGGRYVEPASDAFTVAEEGLRVSLVPPDTVTTAASDPFASFQDFETFISEPGSTERI